MTMSHEIVLIPLDHFPVVFYENHLQAIEERIRVLERFQNDSVDAILGNIVQSAISKSLPFCKDALLKQVLRLKVVTLESKHEKVSYFSTVFQPLKGKLLVSDDQFRRYLLVLLGDKEQGKVFDRCLTCPRRTKHLRAVPGQNALGNLMALVSACQGGLRWISSGVMPVRGMDTMCRIIEFVLLGERNQPQRPNA